MMENHDIEADKLRHKRQAAFHEAGHLTVLFHKDKRGWASIRLRENRQPNELWFEGGCQPAFSYKWDEESAVGGIVGEYLEDVDFEVSADDIADAWWFKELVPSETDETLISTRVKEDRNRQREVVQRVFDVIEHERTFFDWVVEELLKGEGSYLTDGQAHDAWSKLRNPKPLN